MADRVWKCRFCKGSGPDPWLATHACPGEPKQRTTTEPDRIQSAIDALRSSISRKRKQGGVHLSFANAATLLAFVERASSESTGGAPTQEGAT